MLKQVCTGELPETNHQLQESHFSFFFFFFMSDQNKLLASLFKWYMLLGVFQTLLVKGNKYIINCVVRDGNQ